MAFNFRLAKVLNFRQRIVDQQSREVGKAARVVAQVNIRINSVQDEMGLLLADQQGASSNINVHHLGQRRSWLDHLETRMEELDQELAEANLELEKCRTRLTEVWRDLEVLQKLKERQKAMWQEEEFRRENRNLDEIGQIRADRQRREKLARN